MNHFRLRWDEKSQHSKYGKLSVYPLVIYLIRLAVTLDGCDFSVRCSYVYGLLKGSAWTPHHSDGMFASNIFKTFHFRSLSTTHAKKESLMWELVFLQSVENTDMLKQTFNQAFYHLRSEGWRNPKESFACSSFCFTPSRALLNKFNDA